MSPGESVHNISQFKKRTLFLDEKEVTAGLLQHLIVQKNVKGKRIHDSNIGATMKHHNIDLLLTENPKDFAAFEDIQICTISEVEKLISQIK